jgi:tRNA uridine 5-carbamoylmethylation protein Kti12
MEGSMTKICYIMVGVSGSGKSTLVNQLRDFHASKNESVAVSSLDTYRIGMFDQIVDDPKKAYAEAFKYANDNPQRFNEYVNKSWASDLKADIVIVDNTNLTRKSRARWIQDARSKGFTITAVNVMCPLAVVIERQSSRTDKSVPLDVVRDMYFRLQEVQADEYDLLMHYDGWRGGNPSTRISFD